MTRRNFLCLILLAFSMIAHISCIMTMKKINFHPFYDGPEDPEAATIQSIHPAFVLQFPGIPLASIDGKLITQNAKIVNCKIKPGKHIIEMNINTFTPEDISVHSRIRGLDVFTEAHKWKKIENFKLEFDFAPSREYRLLHCLSSIVETKDSIKKIHFGISRPWLLDVQKNQIEYHPVAGEFPVIKTLDENGIPILTLSDSDILPETEAAFLEAENDPIFVYKIQGEFLENGIKTEVFFQNPVNYINDNKLIRRIFYKFRFVPGKYRITVAFIKNELGEKSWLGFYPNARTIQSQNDSTISFYPQPGKKYMIRAKMNEKKTIWNPFIEEIIK